MRWDEKCLLELTHHNMFESTEHRNRFREILNCYYTAPFFTKGLCKCMYLGTWDDVHYADLMSIINLITIEGTRSLKTMADEGDAMSEQLTGADAEIYKLSTSFITNRPYTLPDLTMIDPEGAHIIRQGLLASKYIDDLPDPVR